MLAENTPEELAVRGEIQACIRSAVASLPTHERLVTVLFYGCHYSYNEVSALLKIPLTTVKKRLYSARQRLRAQLQAVLNEENAIAPLDESEIVVQLLARWIKGIKQWTKERNGCGFVFSNPRTPGSCSATGRSVLAQGYGS